MLSKTVVRVRYAETDKMGIVHHANYYVWFELGRSDFCRARGFSYLEMEEEQDRRLVVAASSCRYISPAFYDDELVVSTRLEKLRSRSLAFRYEVSRPKTNTILATGETIHIATDSQSNIRRIPDEYRRLLTAES